MNDTWLISDTHFNHEMLIREGFRNFESVEEMNERIVNNWNDTVSPQDTVYFLGDFAFGKEGNKWLSLLNGNIIIIRGNHDSGSLSKITAIETTFEGHKLLLLHNPRHADWFPAHDIIIHGHVHKAGNRTFTARKGTIYANVNLEFHNYKPKLINEVVGMVVNNMEAPWITYGGLK